MGAALAIALTAMVATQMSGAATPRAEKYRDDPIGYVHEIIGADTWSAQDDILNAMLNPRARVAVRSAQKIGKSVVASFIALWFYECFENARVILTAPKMTSIDDIVWKELRRFFRDSKEPIEGTLGLLSKTGLKRTDCMNEVVGRTGEAIESIAGISGENLLYIVDEASGIPRDTIEAIEGNLAAGNARLILISNPTRTEGVFFDAFYKDKNLWETFTISALDSPNVVAGKTIFKGMCSREQVDLMRAMHGEDSAWWKIRMLGQHVLNDTGKILSVQAILEAQERWLTVEATGRLQIGIDPAGAGGSGDESTFAVRRGNKIVELVALRGLSPAAHVVHALGILSGHRTARDPAPVLAIDSEGAAGWDVYCAFREHANKPRQNDFELFRVRASDKAQRLPFVYERVRDELWANLERWIREGGAIPQDAKLEAELHCPEWQGQLSGKLKATAKDDMRRALDRSPDRADAVCLACWSPSLLEDETVVAQSVALRGRDDEEYADNRTGDVYGSRMYGGGRTR